MPDAKDAIAMILAKHGPKPEAASEPEAEPVGGEGLEVAAEGLLSAVAKNDVGGVIDALRSAFLELSSEPADEE